MNFDCSVELKRDINQITAGLENSRQVTDELSQKVADLVRSFVSNGYHGLINLNLLQLNVISNSLKDRYPNLNFRTEIGVQTVNYIFSFDDEEDIPEKQCIGKLHLNP